jgi:hypothetical protein
MKTLVAPRHEIGPAVNGHDYCFARAGNNGLCPGHETAKWLNELGEDHEIYTGKITCGEVRDNWIRGSAHIVARDPILAALRARERQLRNDLARVRAEIRRIA